MNVAEAAEKALRMVRDSKGLAYDTETSGLDWKRNVPVGYVFTDEDTDLYIPVRHGGGGNLPGGQTLYTATDELVQHQFERDLADAFREREAKGYMTIGHNLKFDAHMSASAGILLGRNLSCTQNYETLLDEYSKSFSLDACARRHGVTAKKGEGLYQHLADLFGCAPDKKSMAHFWETSGTDPVVVEYACGDGRSTLELHRAQRKQIEAEDLAAVAKVEDDLIWTLFRMERRGIRVDEDYLREVVLVEINERLQESRRALPEGFNPRSPKDMRELCETAGRTDWPLTEKGNPSFTEKWLSGFPEGEHVVVLRKWSNLANSFVTPLLENHVFNGRVHANFNQLKNDDYGTIARLSCSQPNLQQIPKRDKQLAALFRRAFLADENHDFNEADWSQCEPRLFAHYSEEPVLIKGYNQVPFRDMHAVVAEMLDVERDPTAKRMNMGILTGMYPKAFAAHIGWGLDEATQKWEQWFEAFPSIRDFQEMATRVLKQRGYVRTLLGRRGRLEAPRFAYRAVSKIIQGGNADIIKHKLVEIDKMFEAEGDEAQLLCTVHDSIEWQSPQTPKGVELSKEVVRLMEDVQGPPFNLLVPFVAEADSGRNWKEASFGLDQA